MRFLVLPLALLSAAAAAEPSAGRLLPEIPGYQLRVLDVRKPLKLRVNDSWVDASLPVFFYYPQAQPALDAIRGIRKDLVETARDSGWDEAKALALAERLDAVAAALERRSP